LRDQDCAVLITNSNSLVALSVLRSLNKRAVKTVFFAQERFPLIRFSHFNSETIACPSAQANCDVFMSSLLRAIQARKYTTIFPLGDDSVLKISAYRAKIEPFARLALPNHRSVLIALDKSETLRVGDDLGIPVPKTYTVSSLEQVKKLSRTVTYPVVLKPIMSYSWQTHGGALYSRPFYVTSPVDLEGTYERMEKSFPTVMIQEYIPGYNVSVGMLFDSGSVKAACCIRVYRAFPVSGGTGVLRESIPPDPEIVKYASDLLGNLHWHGVAEVEFKVDSRDGRPKLMEINPRFWGSMDVAIASGIDFPYLLLLIAKGERINPMLSYKPGVKLCWLNGDIQILQTILNGRAVLRKERDCSKAQAILRFLQFYNKGLHYDGLALNDPLPFLVDEAYFAYGLCKTAILRDHS
jgi:predicted ATP-grasp superfamily ATP-dependent carboligase